MHRLLIIFLLFTSILNAQSINIIKYVHSNTLKNASWGVYAQYVESSKTILDYNSDLSLTPASGLKLFTTATALDILGGNFHFKTRLYADSPINNGILDGNLIIIGGGDPTLGSNRVKGSLPLDSLMLSWTTAIKSAGIKKIDGDVIAYTNPYDEQDTPGYWYWIDIGNYYGAGCGSLDINDNLYNLFFRPSRNVGGPATVLRTEPLIDNLTFINFMKTGARGSGDNGYIFGAPGQFNPTLRGTIPAGADEFDIKGSIPDPALFTAQYLRKNLIQNSIPVTGTAKVSVDDFDFREDRIIYTTKSPALKDIIYYINKRSFNLYAEGVAKMAGLKLKGTGSNENSIKAMKAFLEKENISIDGLDLYDACGLSPSNTITPKMMVDLLIVMTQHREFDSYYNSLAVAGDKNDPGFFSDWGAGTAMANNARIKSGLINRVRSHSGYVRDKKGRLIAFSMIANNYSSSLKAINNLHKEIIIKLAELE